MQSVRAALLAAPGHRDLDQRVDAVAIAIAGVLVNVADDLVDDSSYVGDPVCAQVGISGGRLSAGYETIKPGPEQCGERMTLQMGLREVRIDEGCECWSEEVRRCDRLPLSRPVEK
jgi:hypothetical protein